jgi:hypothetical protein
VFSRKFRFPGRCPGLICSAPAGQETKRRNIKTGASGWYELWAPPRNRPLHRRPGITQSHLDPGGFTDITWVNQPYGYNGFANSGKTVFGSSPPTGYGPAGSDWVIAAGSAVPEPSSALFLGIALTGVGGLAWRKLRGAKVAAE